MPPTVRERSQGVKYHHDFVSVSGDYIIEQIAAHTNNVLIGLHQNEGDVAFIQANDKPFPIKSQGTVYQMAITGCEVAQFDLHWKTRPDGARHYDSAVASYMVKWKELKWTDVDSVEEVQAEFEDKPTTDTFYFYFYNALSEKQKEQLARSH